MRRFLDQSGHRFWPQLPSDDQLRWAAASVQSRAHARVHGGTILLPVADCFNHSPSNANCEVVQHTDAIEVVTTCEIDPGEELLLCYGQFSNAELLFNAGFTCWPNEHDCLLVSPAALLAAAEHFWEGELPDFKRRMQRLDAQPARLTAAMPLLGCGIPAKTVTVLAGLLIEQDQWNELVEQGGGGELHDAWVADTVAGNALRMRLLHCLLRVLQGVERRFATSIDSDVEALKKVEAALSQPASRAQASLLRRLNALRVRLGERQVLQRLETALMKRKAALEAAQPTSKRARFEEKTES
eukprot:symbB.v1.2.038314.t1/scaffold5926.1/size22390/2